MGLQVSHYHNFARVMRKITTESGFRLGVPPEPGEPIMFAGAADGVGFRGALMPIHKD